ncbi:MAG: ATP-binding protein [Candidatus Nomurabacteria bacterium]|jgi:predicted AAA+ superfamily ATPase|nr:ATP-binding protein [Candidatus Nomurabacteria bacterium]
MENEIIKRQKYLDEILGFVDKPVIKVLTGIRRGGKSSLMQMIKQHLVELSDSQESVLYINFELLKYINITNQQELAAHLKTVMTAKTRYILLDEIQFVDGWEIVVNGLHAARKYDIYITGSNSNLLSGELSTRLAGRFVEFHIGTLTFSEHLYFQKQLGEPNDVETEFNKYLRIGGFPVIQVAGMDAEQGDKIVADIYNSIILRDLVKRKSIRNTDQLDRIVKFALGNIGNTFSAKSIADYLRSQNRQINPETIYSYLDALEEAFVIARVNRYDIRGKETLKTFEKFYVADHSILRAVLGDSPEFTAGILENIVYNELLYRGYTVNIGKIANKEIDFVAVKGRIVKYIQVAYKLDSIATVEREFGALSDLKNGEKLVITMEKDFRSPSNDIQHHNLTDWLVGQD